MQTNSQGHRDRFERKSIAQPEQRGLRAEGSRVDEAAPAEVMKSFASGVVTECVRLNVRKTPSADGEIAAIVDCLTSVTVDLESSTDEFYKISAANGIEGFCMKKYIALKR